MRRLIVTRLTVASAVAVEIGSPRQVALAVVRDLLAVAADVDTELGELLEERALLVIRFRRSAVSKSPRRSSMMPVARKVLPCHCRRRSRPSAAFSDLHWQELLPLPQPGDTLKFWKSDRWGRSTADVLATVNELRDRGVRVVSLTENFDLGTKEGRLHVRRAGPGRRVRARAACRAPGQRDRRGPPPPGRGPDAARQEAHRPSLLPPAPPSSPPCGASSPAAKSVTEAARILKIGRSTAYAALAATLGTGR